jgi:hypothetical protein
VGFMAVENLSLTCFSQFTRRDIKYSLLTLIIVVAMMAPWVWRSYKMYDLAIFYLLSFGLFSIIWRYAKVGLFKSKRLYE